MPDPAPKSAPTDDSPRHPFGRAADRVSILGMGGHHLGDIKSVDESVKLIH